MDAPVDASDVPVPTGSGGTAVVDVRGREVHDPPADVPDGDEHVAPVDRGPDVPGEPASPGGGEVQVEEESAVPEDGPEIGVPDVESPPAVPGHVPDYAGVERVVEVAEVSTSMVAVRLGADYKVTSDPSCDLRGNGVVEPVEAVSDGDSTGRDGHRYIGGNCYGPPLHPGYRRPSKTH